MPIEVKAYKCNWCHRCFGRKSSAVIHENACKNNPAKRQCITCVHGVINVGKSEFSSWRFFTGAPYCDVHNKPIHEKPYYIRCDTEESFVLESGQRETYPVPGTCHHYKYKGNSEWTHREVEQP